MDSHDLTAVSPVNGAQRTLDDRRLPAVLQPQTIALRQVALEAAIWGTPLVSFCAMREAFVRDAGAIHGDIVYLSKPADCHFQLATPNASTHYVYFNFTVKDGPLVLEVPPAAGAGLFGSLLDAWQLPVVDIGPTGEDAGAGGKYLLVPPGYDPEIPAGYIPVRLRTFNGYGALRAIPIGASEDATAKALELVRQLRLYALGTASPEPPNFIDMAGKQFDGIVRFDASYFEKLWQMIDEEPAMPRDAAILQTLRTLGVAKGEPFSPNPSIQTLLTEAAAQAHRELVRAAAGMGALQWPEGRWHTPSGTIGPETGFAAGETGVPNIWARGLYYFMACAPPKKPGKAAVYLTTFVDGAGHPLSGSKTYRLRVPPNVPAAQFWAATVYACETASFIANSPRVEVNSFDPTFKRNGDGSVDLYFSPKAPPGREANWIATAEGATWFVVFRLYGPPRSLAEAPWRLSDLQEVPASLLIPPREGAGNGRSSEPHSSREGRANLQGTAVAVTADNFVRAETDLNIAYTAKAGGLGRFIHVRELTPVDKQTTIRPNRDTLYSLAVFDLNSGPVTVTMPNAGRRFMSMQVIDEDHYTRAVVYGAGRYTLSRKKIRTRYVLVGVRTLLDPTDSRDIREAHALQDAIKVNQKGPGTFEIPAWDPATRKKVREALLALGTTIPDTRRMFGDKEEVDPIRHLIGTAMGFGGNPERDAMYLNVTPSQNDGSTIYKLTVREVPVEAFWSISVYNAEGYFQPNAYDAYTVNSITAKKEPDGSIVVQFGGCDARVPNCLPVMKGWNYLVRLYRPRGEVLTGKWTFPEAQPI